MKKYLGIILVLGAVGLIAAATLGKRITFTGTNIHDTAYCNHVLLVDSDVYANGVKLGGGGAAGTLQEVTDLGNTTTNNIIVKGGSTIFTEADDNSASIGIKTTADGSSSTITFAKVGVGSGKLSASNLSNSPMWNMANASGTVPLLATIGSNTGQFQVGRVALISGTVTVTDSKVAANSAIIATGENGSNNGLLKTSRSAGVSFTIISSNSSDNNFVDYIIYY